MPFDLVVLLFCGSSAVIISSDGVCFFCFYTVL